jgi:hypothetical protein
MYTTCNYLYRTYTFICSLLIISYPFCRYEWKHHGSAHIHGFLWLVDAPNMERLNWEDPNQIYDAKSFFDNYVTAWNPRENHDTHMAMHQSIEDDPCLLDTKEIFASNPLEDYEQLLNRVQRHTKCNEKTCLRRKGTTLECRYKFPWKVQMESSLYIDEMGQKTYRPTHAMMSASISIILTYSKHGEKM